MRWTGRDDGTRRSQCGMLSRPDGGVGSAAPYHAPSTPLGVAGASRPHQEQVLGSHHKKRKINPAASEGTPAICLFPPNDREMTRTTPPRPPSRPPATVPPDFDRLLPFIRPRLPEREKWERTADNKKIRIRQPREKWKGPEGGVAGA